MLVQGLDLLGEGLDLLALLFCETFEVRNALDPLRNLLDMDGLQAQRNKEHCWRQEVIEKSFR